MAPEGEKDICPIFQNIDPIVAPKKRITRGSKKKWHPLDAGYPESNEDSCKKDVLMMC